VFIAIVSFEIILISDLIVKNNRNIQDSIFQRYLSIILT